MKKVLIMGVLCFSTFAQANVCERTPSVVYALENALRQDCSTISPSDLEKIKEIYVIPVKVGTSLILHSGDFDGLSSLTYLNLRARGIQSLPADLFQPLKAIQTINLAENPISSFTPDAIKGLPSLNTFYLDAENLPVEQRSLLMCTYPKVRFISLGTNFYNGDCSP